jgi:hypothetical protein
MNDERSSNRILELSPDQMESVETAKLIRKLRWIGKEAEARTLELKMTQYRVSRASVLPDALDTD